MSDHDLDPMEQRLSDALASRAARVDEQLRERPPAPVPSPRRSWPLVGLAAAAAVLLVSVLAVALTRGDDPQAVVAGGPGTSSTQPSSTTSAAPTTSAGPIAPTCPGAVGAAGCPAPTTESTSTTRPRATTTTQAAASVDRTIVGWPGKGSTTYPTARAAATAFATTVLGFEKPTFRSQSSESVPVGGTATVKISPRPQAGASTTVTAMRNGPRSWVVRGTTSDQGTIARSTFGAGRIDVAGEAVAFEATVTLRALTLDGRTIGSSTTMAGGTERQPYTGSVGYRGGSAAFVLAGESDASAGGDLVWACVVLDPALG